MSTLTLDAIRAAVATYVPDRLACFDDMTSKPLAAPDAPPVWSEEMRMTLFLFMWTDYDKSRPN